jgi:fluoroquinolone resistance protein
MTLANNSEYFSQNFTSIDAAGESFSEIIFENCTFQQCTFTETRFYKCKFVDCDFIASNLSNIKIDYSKFYDTSFKASKLVGVDWTKADWPRFNTSAPISFSECIINDSSFFGLHLNDLLLEHCKAQDVDFRGCNLSRAKFCYSDLTSSLFLKTNLREADFSEAENYDIDIFNNEIKAARFSRMEAVRLLNSLDIELVD